MVVDPRGLEKYIVSSGRIFSDKADVALRQFSQLYDNLINIVNKAKPKKWGMLFYAALVRLSRKTDFDYKVQQFINTYFSLIWDSLREIEIKDGSIPRTAIHVVNIIKDGLPEPELILPSNVFSISLQQIIDTIPEMTIARDENIIWLIYCESSKLQIKIPLAKGVLHKGGPARFVLKAFFKSDLIAPEIPIRDFDILVKDDEVGVKFLQLVGETDQSGKELYKNILHVLASRDVTMNQCVLGPKGLIYTKEAEESVKSGIIMPCATDHGLYGKDSFTHKGHRFVKERSLERLIKFVSEGKANSFLLKKENLQIFLGIRFLLLVVRVVNKEDCCERLEKIYYLLDQMRQIEMYNYVFQHHSSVNGRCRNIFDLLENCHKMYPFINIEKRGEDEGIARWMMKNLLKWLFRIFKEEYRLHDADFTWLKLDENEEVAEFSLRNFRSNPVLINDLQNWWSLYLENCRQRNQIYDKQNK
ncbi:MAG: hypothetical protein ACD_58C00239G0003 [uncultured bacterium]|nr:MAG: hypothetical protein ACD_58C00239G0003 [uncultured bacterium]